MSATRPQVQQLELFALGFGARVIPRPDLGEGAFLVKPGRMLATGMEEEIGPKEVASLLGYKASYVRSHPHRFGARQVGRRCRLRFSKRHILEMREKRRTQRKEVF